MGIAYAATVASDGGYSGARVLDGQFGCLWSQANPPSCAGGDREPARGHSPALMTEAVQRHLQAKIAETQAPVELRQLSARKGNGLFATTSGVAGSILWREAPVVAPLQHLTNRNVGVTCDACCRWLGSVSDMAESMLLVARSVTGGCAAKRRAPKPSAYFQCPDMCGAVYCSEACRDSAWESQHRLLCIGCGGVAPEEMSEGRALHRGALLRFEQHAAECNEALLLAARVIATILCAWENAGCTPVALEQAKAQFAAFHNPPWWDVTALRHTSTREAGIERKAMEQELRRSLRILELALLPCHRSRCPELFQLEFYARLVGMFECNNVSVEIECPATQLLHGIPQSSDSDLGTLSAELRAELEAADLPDWEFKGTGLFTLLAMLNHSCSPNCCIEYGCDATARVKLLRDVAAGEELCISYIDEDAEYEDRQRQLCEYGFVCDCPRCVKCRS